MKKNEKIISENLFFTPTEIEFLEVNEQEKAQGIKKARITVIQAGLSSNLNFYSSDVLSKLPTFVEARPKMYLDHDMWGGAMGRSMKEWAATITKCWYDSATEKVKADIRLTSNPNTSWLYEEMRADPQSVGCSIDARVMAHSEKKKIGENELEVNVVDGWVRLNSVDFVTYAAAGGGIERVAASESPVDLLAALIQRAIQPNTSPKTTEAPQMTLEELKAQFPELVKQLQESALAAHQAAKTEADFKAIEAQKQAAEAKYTELNTALEAEKAKVAALDTEKKDLAAKLDVYLTKEAEAKHRAMVDSKLAESVKKGSLTDKQITEAFKNILYGLSEEAKIDQLISEREEAFKTPVIRDNGTRSTESQAPAKKFTDDELVASIKSK